MTSFQKLKVHVQELLQRLPPDLHYHGLQHTSDVLQAVELIASHEKVSDRNLLMLKTAALYHDVGFLETYNGHEAAGCARARLELPGFGFSSGDIDAVCGMIMATKIPQEPNTHLEKILADADLEYLGTNRFKEIGDQLFYEMMAYKMLSSAEEWNRLQLRFLKAHRYHTDFCIKEREPAKQQHIAALEQLLA